MDLVNISYGEQFSDLSKGKLLELCDSVVNKHGVIIIASAGNEGPCLSTVGAPGMHSQNKTKKTIQLTLSKRCWEKYYLCWSFGDAISNGSELFFM